MADEPLIVTNPLRYCEFRMMGSDQEVVHCVRFSSGRLYGMPMCSMHRSQVKALMTEHAVYVVEEFSEEVEGQLGLPETEGG